jgi:hypothetical protein
MTDEEWKKLYENYETLWLLAAVDHVVGSGLFSIPPA